MFSLDSSFTFFFFFKVFYILKWYTKELPILIVLLFANFHTCATELVGLLVDAESCFYHLHDLFGLVLFNDTSNLEAYLMSNIVFFACIIYKKIVYT